jgi:dTDP-glucose pyrophosphorylase
LGEEEFKVNSQDIRKMTIFPETSLKTAMKTLSNSNRRILFVIDDKERLIGSLTDGDVRRAILNNIGFDKPISEMMFRCPRFVRSDEGGFREKAKECILHYRLHAIPVLDKVDSIVDVLFWYDFFESHPHELFNVELLTNSVVIMAGGKGTRLDPFTKILPKPLIPFGDKPIAEVIMDNFNKHGFTRFILTLNYKKEIIKMYFKENKSSYDITWVEEEEYLGTAGSLGLLKDKITETFFVCNCDILLTSDFRRILLWHKSEGAIATLVGCHKEMVIPYGTLEINEGVLKAINEKPTFDLIINTGVYIMEPEVLKLISIGERLDMNHLLERAMKHGKVTVYPVAEGWFDIGQWKEYRDSLYLLQNGE